jgi:xanthine dehydrogenase accessory factor
MLELLDQILRRAIQGETSALCTIVRTRGSTPQEKGAAMLVLEGGKTLGTLGGGCVEAEVRTRALRLMQERQSRLLTFRLDQDYGWDDGLVCGGIMDIAVQVIDSAATAAPLQQLRDEMIANHEAVWTIEVADEHGQTAKFEIPISPTPMLLIAGAGHVASALARIVNGFHVTVIDDRADYASPHRFPGVRCVVGDIEQELKRFPIDHQTYIVIVTRGHRHDAAALAAVVQSPAKYVGLIGSKHKIRTILRELHRQGISREILVKVHAPIGLKIGAVTPAEIAVSIAAEIIAIRRGQQDRSGMTMKISAEQLDRWLESAAEKNSLATDENTDAHR